VPTGGQRLPKAPDKYDCFMVHVHSGTNGKLGRLTDAEYRCHVGGVLAIAAMSPYRGALLIAEGVKADERDVARLSGKSVPAARSAMSKLRELGILEADDDGVEWVHDWDVYNPPPAFSETKEAQRLRKQKSQATAKGNHDVAAAIQGQLDSLRKGRDVTREFTSDSRENHATEVRSRKKEERTRSTRTSGRQANGKQEPSPVPQLPAGLSGFLGPVADTLRSVAASRPAALAVTDGAVAKTLQDFSTKDLWPEAQDFGHYWLHGAGAGKPMRDVVQTWRNRLRTRPDVIRKSLPPGPGGAAAAPAAAVDETAERLRKADL
jgi:hypothetical protein